MISRGINFLAVDVETYKESIVALSGILADDDFGIIDDFSVKVSSEFMDEEDYDFLNEIEALEFLVHWVTEHRTKQKVVPVEWSGCGAFYALKEKFLQYGIDYRPIISSPVNGASFMFFSKYASGNCKEPTELIDSLDIDKVMSELGKGDRYMSRAEKVIKAVSHAVNNYCGNDAKTRGIR